MDQDRVREFLAVLNDCKMEARQVTNKYESTWTMRFSNFIQFSKLVLINAVQIPMLIF